MNGVPLLEDPAPVDSADLVSCYQTQDDSSDHDSEVLVHDSDCRTEEIRDNARYELTIPTSGLKGHHQQPSAQCQ